MCAIGLHISSLLLLEVLHISSLIIHFPSHSFHLHGWVECFAAHVLECLFLFRVCGWGHVYKYNSNILHRYRCSVALSLQCAPCCRLAIELTYRVQESHACHARSSAWGSRTAGLPEAPELLRVQARAWPLRNPPPSVDSTDISAADTAADTAAESAAPGSRGSPQTSSSAAHSDAPLQMLCRKASETASSDCTACVTDPSATERWRCPTLHSSRSTYTAEAVLHAPQVAESLPGSASRLRQEEEPRARTYGTLHDFAASPCGLSGRKCRPCSEVSVDVAQ